MIRFEPRSSEVTVLPTVPQTLSRCFKIFCIRPSIHPSIRLFVLSLFPSQNLARFSISKIPRNVNICVTHNTPLTLPSTAQSVYNAQRAGITSAIVICILLPLGICAFCLIMHLRNKAIERGEGSGGPPPKASNGRTNVDQRFSPVRSSGNSSAKKGSTDSDRDSGFHVNGKVTTAPNRNNSDADVRYNNERFQRKAPEREDSLKAGIVRQPREESKAESYSGSKGSSVSDLLDLESPPPPASRSRDNVSKPSLEDVVRHRPPVTRLPSSSGRSTPSSPTSPASSSGPVTKPFPFKTPAMPKSESEGASFQPKQPLRGSSRSSSSDRLLAEKNKTDSLPLLSSVPLATAPPLSAKSSSASSNFKPEPTRGSGRSSSAASNKRPDPATFAGGAIPKTKTGPGSLTSSSASSPPPPPIPSTLPPPLTTDSEDDETDVSPSDFDGSYYTNEPLVDKPRIEFPVKTMDTEINMKQYKPFSVPNKKPSAL